MTENAEQGNTVIIEAKVQTIYYENNLGNIEKHFHVSSKRVSNKQAKEILEDLGIKVTIVLRVLTERIDIELERDELQDKIKHSERFYQSKD